MSGNLADFYNAQNSFNFSLVHTNTRTAEGRRAFLKVDASILHSARPKCLWARLWSDSRELIWVLMLNIHFSKLSRLRFGLHWILKDIFTLKRRFLFSFDRKAKYLKICSFKKSAFHFWKLHKLPRCWPFSAAFLMTAKHITTICVRECRLHASMSLQITFKFSGDQSFIYVNKELTPCTDYFLCLVWSV